MNKYFIDLNELEVTINSMEDTSASLQSSVSNMHGTVSVMDNSVYSVVDADSMRAGLGKMCDNVIPNMARNYDSVRAVLSEYHTSLQVNKNFANSFGDYLGVSSNATTSGLVACDFDAIIEAKQLCSSIEESCFEIADRIDRISNLCQNLSTTSGSSICSKMDDLRATNARGLSFADINRSNLNSYAVNYVTIDDKLQYDLMNIMSNLSHNPAPALNIKRSRYGKANINNIFMQKIGAMNLSLTRAASGLVQGYSSNSVSGGFDKDAFMTAFLELLMKDNLTIEEKNRLSTFYATMYKYDLCDEVYIALLEQAEQIAFENWTDQCIQCISEIWIYAVEHDKYILMQKIVDLIYGHSIFLVVDSEDKTMAFFEQTMIGGLGKEMLKYIDAYGHGLAFYSLVLLDNIRIPCDIDKDTRYKIILYKDSMGVLSYGALAKEYYDLFYYDGIQIDMFNESGIQDDKLRSLKEECINNIYSNIFHIAELTDMNKMATKEGFDNLRQMGFTDQDIILFLSQIENDDDIKFISALSRFQVKNRMENEAFFSLDGTGISSIDFVSKRAGYSFANYMYRLFDFTDNQDNSKLQLFCNAILSQVDKRMCYLELLDSGFNKLMNEALANAFVNLGNKAIHEEFNKLTIIEGFISSQKYMLYRLETIENDCFKIGRTPYWSSNFSVKTPITIEFKTDFSIDRSNNGGVDGLIYTMKYRPYAKDNLAAYYYATEEVSVIPNMDIATKDLLEAVNKISTLKAKRVESLFQIINWALDKGVSYISSKCPIISTLAECMDKFQSTQNNIDNATTLITKLCTNGSNEVKNEAVCKMTELWGRSCYCTVSGKDSLVHWDDMELARKSNELGHQSDHESSVHFLYMIPLSPEGLYIQNQMAHGLGLGDYKKLEEDKDDPIVTAINEMVSGGFDINTFIEDYGVEKYTELIAEFNRMILLGNGSVSTSINELERDYVIQMGEN